MNEELLVERLFQVLIRGDRQGAKETIEEARTNGWTAEQLTEHVYWSVLDLVGSLYRSDKMTTLAHHYAIRLLRRLVDQAQAEFAQQPANGRRLLMFSGQTEADELAGQLMANLAEAEGYEVYFGGGGIANDEILNEVGNQRPDVLLMFASSPSDAPNIRELIDTIRGVDSCPEMQIAVGGGVFNRAEGLAEEIGADLWAKSPREMLDRLETEKDRRATAAQRTVGRTRQANRSEAA